MVTELNYDRSLHDEEHLAGPFEITKASIQGFTRSIGGTNPVFLDEAAARRAGYSGIIAPPTYCTVLLQRISLPDIKLQFGRVGMHAGQRVQPKAPVVAGDQLTASSHLKEVYAKTGRSGTMVFVVWETIFTNQNNEVVADVQESFARRE
jgi:acyl dehydratase